MPDRPHLTHRLVLTPVGAWAWSALSGSVARSRVAAAVLTCAAAHGAAAQTVPSTPTPVAMPAARIVTATRVQAIGDSLAPAASRTAQLAAGPGYAYAVTHRDSSGAIEVHAAWTDVFVIQNGSATLVSGGTVDGAHETTPGEWRGGVARGGTRAELHTGDVIVIPAGTPHQMLLPAHARISYLAFKIAASAPRAP